MIRKSPYIVRHSPEFEEKNDLQNAEYQHYDSDDCIDVCHDDLRFG